jgi:hypothetical protein
VAHTVVAIYALALCAVLAYCLSQCICFICPACMYRLRLYFVLEHHDTLARHLLSDHVCLVQRSPLFAALLFEFFLCRVRYRACRPSWHCAPLSNWLMLLVAWVVCCGEGSRISTYTGKSEVGSGRPNLQHQCACVGAFIPAWLAQDVRSLD